MAKRRIRAHFSIQERGGGNLTGPIGPIPVGINLDQSTALYIYQFSEVLVCDYLSEGEEWVRTQLEVKYSGDVRFPRGAIKHVHVIAWLCAMSSYYPFDAESVGWAVDNWSATPAASSDDPNSEFMSVNVAVAAGPKGSRFNRIGYSWTIYTTAVSLPM